jgi:Cu/Ag efflux pump CusA
MCCSTTVSWIVVSVRSSAIEIMIGGMITAPLLSMLVIPAA